MPQSPAWFLSQSEPAAYGVEGRGGVDLSVKAEAASLRSSGGRGSGTKQVHADYQWRKHASLQQQVRCSLQGNLAPEVCLELWVSLEREVQWVSIPQRQVRV